MAHNQRVIPAPPDAVFDVLADPRGYAYWVVGSRKIRDADECWPAQGSRFHHAVGLGPICIRDHSKVEEMQSDRFLQLKVKFRPFGTARVKLELEPADTGTRVTMIEDPADSATAFLFTPLTHLLLRWRNVRSLDRLADLVEGRVPMPGDEPAARVRRLDGNGSVDNPLAHGRSRELRRTAGAVARGMAAGFAGGMAMSISTNVEMRLRGRPASDAPARALARVLGINAREKKRKQRLMLAGHFGTSVALGIARGGLARGGVRPGSAGAALFGLALLPDAVIVPALGATEPPWDWTAADVAVTVLHHGVYAAATDAAYALLEART
jgi:uncharacterized protein YndB with AHSA1/START domain